MTVKSKKRRLERRRAHAERRDNRGGTVSTRPIRKAGFSLDGPFSGFMSTPQIDPETVGMPADSTGLLEAINMLGKEHVEIPSRTKCPQCGFSQKVRKDGTMSRHDVFLGDVAAQCAGTGKQWNSG